MATKIVARQTAASVPNNVSLSAISPLKIAYTIATQHDNPVYYVFSHISLRVFNFFFENVKLTNREPRFRHAFLIKLSFDRLRLCRNFFLRSFRFRSCRRSLLLYITHLLHRGRLRTRFVVTLRSCSDHIF